jgi:succinate dehydrogenase hydrophobic anchor subunit
MSDEDPPTQSAGDLEEETGPWWDGYEASSAQRWAALVVAGGLVAIIAGTVISLTAGGCVLDRTSYYGDCTSFAREPWFGVAVLVTVGAALVGSVLGVRDIGSRR